MPSVQQSLKNILQKVLQQKGYKDKAAHKDFIPVFREKQGNGLFHWKLFFLQPENYLKVLLYLPLFGATSLKGYLSYSEFAVFAYNLSLFLQMKTLYLTLLLFFPLALNAQKYRSFPMWDTSLPFETRARDLISRLTPEEKVGQMMHAAPAIPRLGIPGYNWWNEALHGVARTPFPVTVFPQAIALAASWDTAAMHKMADITSTEGRAVHRKATSMGMGHLGYMGLTYWTPNINIFRDPRWGRGQETYGEDPFLTASMGTAFVKGLQGNDPTYLKAAACAKHFAVHSGPEPSRHSDNFNPAPFDLWDTYLPAFRELIVHAGVAGVMCAYNAIYGQPCCANDLLMTDILRRQWNFKGYVTSDCWGIDDFVSFHKTHDTRAIAAVDALIHTTDVECGNSVYATLIESVRTAAIPEQALDAALFRLFMIRFRLGMFDPSDQVPFANIPESALDLPEHRAHALEMARKSIVLLKNQNQTLPLSKNLKKIAVLGPNADNAIVQLGNYNGIPSAVTTVLQGIRDKLDPKAEVVFEQAISYTSDTLFVPEPLPGVFTWEGQPGFLAEYFDNTTLEGKPSLVQMEGLPDHFWHEGAFRYGQTLATHFSARFSAVFNATQDAVLTFELHADDGTRLFIGDEMVVNAWDRTGNHSFQWRVEQGKSYVFKLEYRQGDGRGMVRLLPGQYRKTDFTELAARLQDAEAILFVGGISPQLEGEALPVSYPGFYGGDRTSILLPEVQTRLLKALHATGKPVVLLLMSGSALSVPWEDQHLPAIVQAWYGGQSGGTAVADVLFGDYNPAGRMPVTVYEKDSDLPDFKDYRMEGRTYRYFRGKPLYPFGYGLSYSSFRYKRLRMASHAKAGEAISCKITVVNTGNRAGEEVAQCYLAFPDWPGKAPIRALKGFQRFFLNPGEKKVLEFTIPARELTLPDAQGIVQYLVGKAVISIGGGQPGVEGLNSSEAVSRKTIILH